MVKRQKINDLITPGQKGAVAGEPLAVAVALPNTLLSALCNHATGTLLASN